MDPLYKLNVNTFIYPPSGSYDVNELEKIVIERLHLYKFIENARNWPPDSKKFEKYVIAQIRNKKLQTYMLLLESKGSNDKVINARKYNHIAHWTLSLSYANNSELRKFFLHCEVAWFTILFKRLSKEDLRAFLQDNNFMYTQVNESEKMMLKNKLLMCRHIADNVFNTTTYYKSYFTDIISLVEVRKVFVYKGFAYFPQTDIIYSIKCKLWLQFSERLDWIQKNVANVLSDQRLQDYLFRIPLVKPSLSYIDEISITLENIDQVAEENYPLCMKSIHNILRENHHLKYDCKMQYGIFLKHLGLSFDDAMELWRSEFTKKLSEDIFKRKYSYLFKHQYGLVGSKINYKPYTCLEILNKNPGIGQHHGCPFKHWDIDKLLGKCREDGLKSDNIDEVRNLVAQKRYKEACTLYFNARHNALKNEPFNDPNEYAFESYGLERDIDGLLNVLMVDMN